MPMQQQRPPPGNEHDPLLGRIIQELSKNVMPGGWQAGLELRTRAMCIMNLCVLSQSEYPLSHVLTSTQTVSKPCVYSTVPATS